MSGWAVFEDIAGGIRDAAAGVDETFSNRRKEKYEKLKDQSYFLAQSIENASAMHMRIGRDISEISIALSGLAAHVSSHPKDLSLHGAQRYIRIGSRITMFTAISAEAYGRIEHSYAFTSRLYQNYSEWRGAKNVANAHEGVEMALLGHSKKLADAERVETITARSVRVAGIAKKFARVLGPAALVCDLAVGGINVAQIRHESTLVKKEIDDLNKDKEVLHEAFLLLHSGLKNFLFDSSITDPTTKKHYFSNVVKAKIGSKIPDRFCVEDFMDKLNLIMRALFIDRKGMTADEFKLRTQELGDLFQIIRQNKTKIIEDSKTNINQIQSEINVLYKDLLAHGPRGFIAYHEADAGKDRKAIILALVRYFQHTRSRTPPIYKRSSTGYWVFELPVEKF